MYSFHCKHSICWVQEKKSAVRLRSVFGYNRNPISGEAQQSLWVHLKLKRIGYWSIARFDRTRLTTLRSLGALAHLRSHKTIRQAITNRTVLRTKVLKILSYGYCMYTFLCPSFVPHSHTFISFCMLSSTPSRSLPFLPSFLYAISDYYSISERKSTYEITSLCVSINKLIINSLTEFSLIVILNNLQQHVSALKCHLQDECNRVHIKQRHKMEEISFALVEHTSTNRKTSRGNYISALSIYILNTKEILSILWHCIIYIYIYMLLYIRTEDGL